MVNLPSPSQEVNFHTWNFRLRRNRRVVYEDPEPKTLLQLEALANRCALMMSKYEESPHHRETALKLLRQQYNLEFKLQCHKCKTAHQQDELYACAPER